VAAGRPVVCLEPGKHALWPTPATMATEHERIVEACGPRAGADGVHVDNPFGERGLIAAEPLDHRLARLKLRRDAFAPEFDFHPGPGETARLVPWTDLAAFIPARVGELMALNRVSVPHLSAVFLDCGDTIVDEGTEIKDQATDVVSSADLIPGARAMLDGLGKRGHRLALVADGPRATFVNVLGAHGLWDRFEAHVISGDLGVAKPHPRMFATAMTALGLLPNAAGRVVMVGNNLERDIKGANEAGIISVFMSWSDRRSHTPRDASETPDYTIARPDLLPDLLDDIELGLPVSPG
jgi:putative hydrolase of the HAD superfamily